MMKAFRITTKIDHFFLLFLLAISLGYLVGVLDFDRSGGGAVTLYLQINGLSMSQCALHLYPSSEDII